MSDPDSRRPLVSLVGAGPGDPGLLTVRARECLALADFVLYDQLVSRRVLEQIPNHVERMCVSELPGTHPERFPYISQKMIEIAKQGKRVVRLKGGDPNIFGRVGEELTALRNAGIPHEVVPGVTTALAAGAYLDLPLTHREYGSALALVTGHEMPGKLTTKLDWSALAKFPGTIAVYMGVSRLPAIIAEMTKHGFDPNTPALLVHDVSTGEQRMTAAPFGKLEEARRAAGIESPALILIGKTVGERRGPSWFEALPLHGKRVLLTRPRHQAEPWLRRIELLGGIPFLLPGVSIRELKDFGRLDAIFPRLRSGEFHWLVFTSANGVEHFFRRLWAVGRDLRDLGGVRLAVIGPSTGAALRQYHLRPDVVSEQESSSEGLAALLEPLVVGSRVLLARADRGRDLLRARLSAIAEVEQVTVYEQVDSVDENDPIFDHLRRGEIDYVLFSSSNLAGAVLRCCDETIQGRTLRGEVKIAAISPITASKVRELGFKVELIAETYTMDGLLTVVCRDALRETALSKISESIEAKIADDDRSE